MTHPQFPRLFSPFRIKQVELPNRVAISGHFAGWWITEGLPNADFAAYIEERAKGGVGLFVIGATGPTYESGPGFIQNTSDAVIPGYRMLADAAHRHGMKIFAQLLHVPDPVPPGLSWHLRTGMSTSVVPPGDSRPLRPQRSCEQLQRLAATYGPAAARARAAGIDGVELHAHEGFLFAQFLSPILNRRTDDYGGPLVNRMRFMVQTLQAMRDAIGDQMPLGVRLKAHDLEHAGMTTGDYAELVKNLAAMELVDYVSLTAGDYAKHHGPMSRPDGEWLSLVHEVKQTTALPIMHAGRITTAEMAEQALTDGMLDIVCMTKTHIADPHFTRKVREGRPEDIRYCTRCLQSCIGNSAQMSCVYNPLTSRERTWARLEPASKPKRVIVVGAGPAGMEVAMVASARGHEVIVLERGDHVGGQVHLAAASPQRAMFIRIAEYYQRQADKGGFELRLRTEATAETVTELEPDAVVIATGSKLRREQVPGGRGVWTVQDALTRQPGGIRKVLVVDRTGTMHALMAADRLSDLGVEAEYITPAGQVCASIESMTREDMQQRLVDRGVRFSEELDLVRWDGNRALIRHVRLVEECHVDGIDAVVISAGAEPVNDLGPGLSGGVAEVHTIGDANAPRTVQEATFQGGLVGRML